MALVVFTSDNIFYSTDPYIVNIVDGVKVVLYHEKSKIPSVLDNYFGYNTYKYVIVATSFREDPERYGIVKNYLSRISAKEKIPVFTVVNMGYLKIETPSIFRSTDIYYYPSNIAARDRMTKIISENVSLLGAPDVAVEMEKKLADMFSNFNNIGGYSGLKNTLLAIREKHSPNKRDCPRPKMERHNGGYLSYSSPL
mgnify:CR=1 FL=1